MARFFSVLYADFVVIIGGQTAASACDYGGTQNIVPISCVYTPLYTSKIAQRIKFAIFYIMI